MRLLVLGYLGYMVSRLVLWAAGPPSATGGGFFLAVLVALLSGASGAAAFNFYRYRKQGQQERDTMIAEASKEAVETARGLLDEYRRELEKAKVQIRDLQITLTRSNERIARLEQELAKSRDDRERLSVALAAAISKRAATEREIAVMQGRIYDLEQLIDGPSDGGGGG